MNKEKYIGKICCNDLLPHFGDMFNIGGPKILDEQKKETNLEKEFIVMNAKIMNNI